MNTGAEQNGTAISNMTPHVLETIRSAEQELTGLLQRRFEITRRISAIKQMLFGMSELFGSAIDKNLFVCIDPRVGSRQKGLTRACRLVLMESRVPLRIGEGCEELQRRFPDLVRHHKDLRASVTTVFYRLVRYGEARCYLDATGSRVWEWIPERAVVPGNFDAAGSTGAGSQSYARD